MKKLLLVVSMGLLLTGCSSLNNSLVEKKQYVEYYRIFDIKTDASRGVVADAASRGLGRNINSAQEARPIPATSEKPEQPGRFTLTNPFEGTNFAALSGGGGSLGIKIASCNGAVWTAKARRKLDDSDLNITACLWEYKSGYHLDLYATFEKKTGGIMQLTRSMADVLVGTSEEWTEKTFLDVVRSIHKETSAEINYLEGYPEMSGTPWIDEHNF